ncbi:hypothetical protein OROGR_020483 [Orobanche gracilis]
MWIWLLRRGTKAYTDSRRGPCLVMSTQILTQPTNVPIGNAATDQSENIYDDLAWAVENQETTIEGNKNNGDGMVRRRNVTDGQADTSVDVEAPHYDPHIVLDHNTREGGGNGYVGQAGTIVIAKAIVVGWSPTRKKTRYLILVCTQKSRSKCAMNKTLAFRSPFVIRHVNISKRLIKPEIKCGVYALLNLTVDIIDAFVQKDVIDTMRRESFFENMTMELEANKHLHLNDIDIFVFPIFLNRKFFGVCTDARTGNFTVLDNMNVEASDCQRDVLSEYLSSRNQSKWTMMMKNGSFHIPIIEQGDKKDSVDSGVYLMRHMEMFMGDASAKWETGISVKATKQIATLRICYCGELMCWEHNIVKDQVLTKTIVLQ